MNIQQLESMIEQVSREEVEAEHHLARIRADRRSCERKWSHGGPHYHRLARLRTTWRSKLQDAETKLALLRDDLIKKVEMEMAG